MAWVCAIGVFVAVAQSLALPLVALYSQELGAAPRAIGIVLGVGFVLPVLAAVSIGDWVDRIGARRMVVVGAIGLAVAPTIPWIEPSLIALAAMQVVMGVAHLGSVVAAQSYVARIGGPRERNFGWYTTFVSVGQLAGPFLLGVALEATGYPGALATSAVVGVAAVGLAVGLRPMGHPRAPTTPAAIGSSRKRDLASSRPLRLALVASGATLFALGVHQTFFPVYLDRQGIGAGSIGVLVGLRALAAILVRPFLGPLGRVVGDRAVLLGFTLALCALGLVLMPLGPSLAVFAAASVVLGVGSGVSQPMTMVVLSDHVDPVRRGAALGARLSVNFLALGVATVTLGAAVPVVGYPVAFVAGALLPGAAAAMVARAGAQLEAPPRAGPRISL